MSFLSVGMLLLLFVAQVKLGNLLYVFTFSFLKYFQYGCSKQFDMMWWFPVLHSLALLY